MAARRDLKASDMQVQIFYSVVKMHSFLGKMHRKESIAPSHCAYIIYEEI